MPEILRFPARTLMFARPDGYTYDACGRRVCKTHPSQLKDHNRQTLGWTIEKGRKERQNATRPEHYQAQYTQELRRDLDDYR